MVNEILIPESAKILVVAPHPDDESIGCGGLLVKYPQQCHVLLLTNGCKGHKANLTDDECVRIRHEEFATAMHIAGVKVLNECGLEDGKLKESIGKIPEIPLSEYDYIFVPHKDEVHRDHCAANEYFCALYQKQHCQAMLFGYEISRPIRQPTHYSVLNEFFEKKELLIKQYASQLLIEDYVSLGCGLNMYRGAAFKIGLAEAYEQIGGKNFEENTAQKKGYQKKLKMITKKLKKMVRSWLR